SDVHRIAKEIAVFERRVAEMETDAEQHPPVRWQLSVLLRHLELGQERASAALGNSAGTESPAVLPIRPRCPAIKPSTIARQAANVTSVPTSSARVNRLYSATSAERIVVSRRSTLSALS